MSDYYISPTGTNTPTAGTLLNPWATLAYACSQISAGTHTIHASTGTFNEVAQSVVPLGVSIIGAGETETIFKWTGVTSPDYLIKAETSTGATGNHTFSDFTIDGNSRTLTGGLRVLGRSGLTLQNVNFINCSYAGATVLATYSTTKTTPPAFYLTNVLIADCDFTNCSRINGGSSSGVLELSGLDGAEIRNITVNEDTGWGIKFVANGWFKSCSVHHCEINCSNTDPNYKWAASLELWNAYQDCKVYQVNCNTWFSFVGGNKGSGTWALQVYDCRIINTKDDDQYIVPLELAEISDVEVFRVFMSNPGTFGIGGFWQATPSSNIHIHHNICKGGSNPGNTFIRVSPDPGITVSDFYIYNNVVDGNERAINLIAASGFINNIQIKNNIFANLSTAGILITSASTSNVVIESNCFYGVSLPLDNQGGTSVTYTGNLTVDPLFVAAGDFPDPYYRLQSTSLLINAGVDVGLGFLGSAPDIGAFEFFESTFINFAMKSSFELEATGLHLVATARKVRAEVLADAAGVTLDLPTVPDLDDLQRDWQRASATYTGLLGQIEEAISTLPATGGGVSSFTELEDAPATITANQFLKGNAGGTALEFGMPTAANVGAEPAFTTLGVTKGGTGLGTVAANNILYTSGSNTFTATAISTFGRTLINVADAAAGRTALEAEPIITTLPVTKGGTGLSSIAADNILYSSASNALAATAITAFGRSLIDDANASAALTTLGAEPAITTLPVTKGGTGLGTIAANNILYTSGSNTFTASAISTLGRTLINVADAAAGRTALGAEPTITTLPISKGGTGLGSISANRLLYSPSANTLAETILSEFIRGFLDDADAATARATLGANDAANLTTGVLDALRLPLATGTTRGAITTFETGIWTPALEGTTTAGTHTYSVQKGAYLKFDVFCVAPLYINISSKDAAMAGNSRIGGLPFAAKNEANFFQSIVFSQFSNVTFSAGYTFLGGRVDPNTTKVLLIQCGSGVAGTVITAANVGNTVFVGCVLYFTN